MARVRPHTGALVGSLVLLTALTGCLGAGPAPNPGADAGDDAAAAGEPGMISASVLDPGLVPMQEALVTLIVEGVERNATTNVLGIARFENVQPGELTLVAKADGFQDQWINFTLREGQHAEPALTMMRDRAIQFVEQYTYEGLFECSLTYLIITGECDTVIKYVFDETGQSYPLELFNDRNVFEFYVGRDWTMIQVTQEWDDAEQNIGNMMRINLEPAETFEIVEYNDRYARTEGESPIAMQVHPGVLHENASADEVIPPWDGGLFQTRSYHMGLADTHNPGGSEFMGLGGAYQQRFTVHIEVHYERW